MCHATHQPSHRAHRARLTVSAERMCMSRMGCMGCMSKPMRRKRRLPILPLSDRRATPARVIQVLVDAGPVRLGEDGTKAEELAVELGLGHLSVVKVFLPGFEECLGGEERV
jgi:hypothetical protein